MPIKYLKGLNLVVLNWNKGLKRKFSCFLEGVNNSSIVIIKLNDLEYVYILHCI